jgi:hypothetical protein
MRPAFAWFALGLAMAVAERPASAGDDLDRGPSAAFFLFHPDRQAAALLGLFEGSRAAHPAAALAAWKRVTSQPNQLGKPTEAVISFFNPEMIPEWKVLHGAEYRLGFDLDEGKLRWSLVVPRDDGTFAALITALRLTGGENEAPTAEGKLAVERLGGPGAAVGARKGPGEGIVLASSRAVLDRAASGRAELPAIAEKMDSGLVFQVDPGGRALPPGASVSLRRVVALARGLGCLSALGRLAIEGDRLEMELTTDLDEGEGRLRSNQEPPSIDPAWLSGIPVDEAVAFVCLASGQGPAFWDGVFEIADRVDKADPGRANLAPLRTRVNLLAAAAGVRLEADLWPHLRGATFMLLVDPKSPARPSRAAIALHLDADAAARRMADEVLPRLAGLSGGMKRVARQGGDRSGPQGAQVDRSAPRSLGQVAGRPLELAVRDRTVLVGWGEGALGSALGAADRKEGSAAGLLGENGSGAGARRPARAGAFWPGRMPIPVKGLEAPTPLVQALAKGPPIVWIGWNQGKRATDQVTLPGLPATVRRFLEAVPLAASPDVR